MAGVRQNLYVFEKTTGHRGARENTHRWSWGRWVASKPRHLFCSRRAWPRFYLYWSLRHSYLAKMRHYSLLEWIMLNLDLKTAISLKKLRKKQKILFYKMSKYKFDMNLIRILSFKNFSNSDKKWRNESQKSFLEATHRPQDQRWVNSGTHALNSTLERTWYNMAYLGLKAS